MTFPTTHTPREREITVSPGILFWAFRYALGRMTYSVSDVAEALIAHQAELSSNMRAMICREISEAKERDGLGMHMDARQWRTVRDALSRPTLPERPL